eukprot:Phypoly_transcript_04344.p1 GENE.Phypoly_transcript_04344~~Phypoly_transcript_04344.p1  ORF type:complete len:359 (+),score=65.87 Phypoly_transcript_04344:1130-2206(+)
MMLARIPRLIIAKSLPREALRPSHARLVRINTVPALQLISRRGYATNKNEDTTQQTQPNEQQAQEQTDNNNQQGEQQQQQQQAKKGSVGGTIAVWGVLIAGGALLYYTGIAKPLVDYLQENVFGSLKTFAQNLRTNIYHLAGISTEEIPFLPPPLPEGYGGHKYTIVLDMDALATCIQSNGVWKIHKRAGLDYFLNLLAQNYEIVLYTKEFQGVNQSAIFKLDSTGQLFQHTKFRDSGVKLPNMQFTDRLDLFRRDPAKLIFIDSLPSEKTYEHPNVLCVGPPNIGQSTQADTVLIDLAKVLHSFAVYQGADVRPVVHDLQGGDINKKIQELVSRSKNTRATQPQQSSRGGFGGLFGR